MKLHGIKRMWKAISIIIICFFSVIIFLSYKPTEMTGSYSSPPRNVYFLETSGKGTLDLRQLASVESAARYIPNSKVFVLVFTDEKYTFNSYMAALEEKYDVKFNKTIKKDYIEGTPLEPWYRKGDWKKSPYMVSHTSDALRYLTLWKYGGIYLDLDIIFTKMWTVENNLVVAEFGDVFSAGVLVFTKEHPVLLNCLHWLGQNYKPNGWGDNGPHLVTKMVKEYLSDEERKDNITILPNRTFYEIHYREVKKFFDPRYSDEVLLRTKPHPGVHVWNQFSAKIPVLKNSSCAYNLILSKSSPVIYAGMLNA